MVAMSSPWKHPVTGFYYLRKSIPAKLRPKFQGQRELKKSLGTKDARKAKDLFIPELARIEQMLRDVSQPSVQYISLRQAKAYAGTWLSRALNEDNNEREQKGVPDIEKQQLPEDEIPYDLELGFIADLETFDGKKQFVEHDISLTLERYGITVPDKNTESYHWLVETFLQARHHYYQVLQGRYTGHWKEEIPSTYPDLLPDNSRYTNQASAGTSLIDLLSSMKQESGIKEKTKDEYLASINAFIEGGGPSIAELVSSEDVRRYKDFLVRQGQLSSSTITKRIGGIKSVLSYAMDNGLIAENPAAKIRLKGSKNKIDNRVPYSESDLAKIFQSRIYQDKYRPEAGAGEASHWLPLLALYTGARLEELGQLRVRDIQESGGVEYLEITTRDDEDANMSIKSEAGYRIIPLHPKLIELGFVSYVTGLKQEGHNKLFPALKPNRYGTTTQNWSKWWNQRFTRMELGIKDPKKVFHSFRHSFMQRSREANIPGDILKALMGHSTGKDVGMTYGGWVSPNGKIYPYSPEILAKNLNLLSFFKK